MWRWRHGDKFTVFRWARICFKRSRKCEKNRGIIDPSAEPREIEAVYREARGYYSSYYKNEILQASADDHTGELSFDYATPEKREKTSKTNKTQYLTYKVKAGAEDGDTFGINWDKVKSVSGQTYGIRAELKERGFKWDGKTKKWRKE